MVETTRNEDTTEKKTPGALDVPTTDLADLVQPDRDGYFENEDHRPEPLYQYGTVDTSDTGGGSNGAVNEVSPVFSAARAANLVNAAKALDPEDDSVGAEMVTLPQGAVTVTGTTKTAEEGREDVAGALRRLADKPVLLGARSPQQELAGEEAEDISNPDGDDDGKRDSRSTDGGQNEQGNQGSSYAAANPQPSTATTSESSSTAPSQPTVGPGATKARGANSPTRKN